MMNDPQPPGIRIRVRDDGPLLIEGPVVVVDAEGRRLVSPSEKKGIALCRCGASASKPFCDGAHKAIGFASTVRAPHALETDPNASAPDGPLRPAS